jgi:cyclohexadienyl dehydratase
LPRGFNCRIFTLSVLRAEIVKILHVLRGALMGVALLAAGSGMRVLAAAPHFAEPADDAARLYETIDARLSLMPEVAAWKWIHQRPVFDEERERAVLANVVARAHYFGLMPESVQRIFETQMKLARSVQTALFETWRTEGFPPNRVIRDLETDLRPALDALSSEQLAALYWVRSDIARIPVNDSVARSMRHMASFAGVTAQDLAELRNVVHDLKPNSQSIDTVARLRVVRIGTTGDYAPFSLERNGELSGVDIEMAASLAEYLELKPRFVKTTWPTLMEDLLAGRFDVAMSGISNTPERAARAAFSTAYHVDGKTPIARCEDRSRFGNLAEIDKSQVRVIVNPGGTNEQFTREHIAQARIIVHADNRTIFEEIVAGRADVMITDGVEVELQTRRRKELCRTMSGTLTNSAKAVLLPRGSTFAKDVDQWVQNEVARGGVQTRLQRALAKEE